MRSSIISCVAVILLGENTSAFSSSGSVCQRRGVSSLYAYKTSKSCDRTAFLRTSLATIASVTAVLSPTIAFAASEQKDEENIVKGYNRLQYLLDNWDDEVCAHVYKLFL